jgi:hypothetical protein
MCIPMDAAAAAAPFTSHRKLYEFMLDPKGFS